MILFSLESIFYNWNIAQIFIKANIPIMKRLISHNYYLMPRAIFNLFFL